MRPFTYQWRPLERLISVEDYRRAAAKRVPDINPANTYDVLGEVPLSTREEAMAAADVAAQAFQEWRKIPAPRRGAIVRRKPAMTPNVQARAPAATTRNGKRRASNF